MAPISSFKYHEQNGYHHHRLKLGIYGIIPLISKFLKLLVFIQTTYCLSGTVLITYSPNSKVSRLKVMIKSIEIEKLDPTIKISGYVNRRTNNILSTISPCFLKTSIDHQILM